MAYIRGQTLAEGLRRYLSWQSELDVGEYGAHSDSLEAFDVQNGS